MMEMTSFEAMLPEVTAANRSFWEGADVGTLRIQRCTTCGVHRFPDGVTCSSCLSTGVEWVDASGRATLWSWTRMHQVYFPAFADEVPYLVVFVQLEEGPFMISTLVDAPGQLAVDLPLQVMFEPVGDARSIPKFRVAA
jgi:uncharacterized OB-fold protein